MITLNILPNKIKKELKTKLIYISLKNILSILIINICLYAILFLIIMQILSSYYIETIKNTTSITKKGENYEKQVQLINNKIKIAEEIQKDKINWSYLLIFLSNNAPSGISIKNLSINSEKNNITISGNAIKRENLLTYKEVMKNNEIFNNVSFPIQNILEKENINFTITAKINNYEFKEKLK